MTMTNAAATDAPTHRPGSSLALLGGAPVVEQVDPSLFHWPIVTEEDEQAVVAVLRAGTMSHLDITRQFELEWGAYLGTRHNLAHCNGTMSLLAAMFGAGVGRGDQVIVPSLTYWASALPCRLLGAAPVYADIDPVSLCLDPADLEHRITPRTRAIVVVHYCGHPADMDAINAVARRHGVKVIEDVSHAQGTRYKGRMCGSLGDVAGLSMMAGKSFAIGEAGMLSTDDRAIYERAVAFCHYERIRSDVLDPQLRAVVCPDGFATGLPLGGLKGRVNQTCSAMGRVQLRHYPERIAEIQRAMNRFWDLLAGVRGLRAHRPAAGSGSTMGGWYNPLGHYLPEELGDLPVERFMAAVSAEGVPCFRACNFPLHRHPVGNGAVTLDGTSPSHPPSLPQPGELPVSDRLASRCFGIPYFKHDRPAEIERYAAAFRKVAEHAEELR